MEKTIKELCRYKFDTISDVLSLYVLFMSMFLGLKIFGGYMGVSPLKMGSNLEAFVAGYFMWTIMMMAYSDTAYSVMHDADKGTLEQLNMSSISLSRILTVRSFSNLLVYLLTSVVLLLIIMTTTNYWLQIKIFSMLIPIIIGIFSILGIGLIFAGLALIFKRIKSLLNITQYFLIGLVIINPSSEIVSSVLPFRPTIENIYLVMLGGCSFADFSIYNYIIMVANSLFYFGIGLLIFNQCIKVAKNKGLLGQY